MPESNNPMTKPSKPNGVSIKERRRYTSTKKKNLAGYKDARIFPVNKPGWIHGSTDLSIQRNCDWCIGSKDMLVIGNYGWFNGPTYLPAKRTPVHTGIYLAGSKDSRI